MLAAAGYPGLPHQGHRLHVPPDEHDLLFFHAGTATHGENTVAAGGRVLNVVGQGADIPAARSRAYAGLLRAAWPGAQYRTDIAAQNAADSEPSPWAS
ncbi:MAG: hypothetical protein NVS2B7_25110 [Herpetosiphon sp.]